MTGRVITRWHCFLLSRWFRDFSVIIDSGRLLQSAFNTRWKSWQFSGFRSAKLLMKCAEESFCEMSSQTTRGPFSIIIQWWAIPSPAYSNATPSIHLHRHRHRHHNHFNFRRFSRLEGSSCNLWKSGKSTQAKHTRTIWKYNGWNSSEHCLSIVASVSHSLSVCMSVSVSVCLLFKYRH